jgi:dienelactone hydrolase
MLSKQAFDALGRVFVRHGWVFFGPYRRGQGLSAQAGPYIGEEIDKAKRTGGVTAGAAVMVRLLETDHLDDQVAGRRWLRTQSFVDPKRIAVAGNSFGGIETVLGAGGRATALPLIPPEHRSWTLAPALQKAAARAVQNPKAPILFFQAGETGTWNQRALSKAMQDVGKAFRGKIYPSPASRIRTGTRSDTSDRQCGSRTCFDFSNNIALVDCQQIVAVDVAATEHSLDDSIQAARDVRLERISDRCSTWGRL